MAKVLLIAVLSLAAAAAGVLVFLNQQREQVQWLPDGALQATVIPNPGNLQPFELEDHAGNPFTLANLRGKWTFLFFGYTHCPDVCPTTLATLAQLAGGLEGNKADFTYQVVFVTVDPQRDTRERLAEYVPYFNKRFIGVRGEPEKLEKITRQLGVLHAKVESGAGEAGYLVDHTASIILVDPEARFKAVFGAPHTASTMLEDFTSIVSQR